jgi:hypothetical protein
MNPDKRWLAARAEGRLVRVDSLRKGDRFLSMMGASYTYERPDGGNHGAHHAVNDSGLQDEVFAGCAEVERIA